VYTRNRRIVSARARVCVRRVHALHVRIPRAYSRARARAQEKIRSVGTSDGYVSERYPRRCLINREGETRDKRNPASTRQCLSGPTSVSGSILREIPAWGGGGGGIFVVIFDAGVETAWGSPWRIKEIVSEAIPPPRSSSRSQTAEEDPRADLSRV